MCHLDTAQCRILKDSGRFLVKIPWGLGLREQLEDFGGWRMVPSKNVDKFILQWNLTTGLFSRAIYKQVLWDLLEEMQITYTFWVVYKWIRFIVSHADVNQVINAGTPPLLTLFRSLANQNMNRKQFFSKFWCLWVSKMFVLNGNV